MDFDKHEKETTEAERNKEARRLGLPKYTREAFQELYDDFLLYYQYEHLIKDIEQGDVESLKETLGNASLSPADIEQIINDKKCLNESRLQNYKRFMVLIDENERIKQSSSGGGKKAAGNNVIVACRSEILEELVSRYKAGEIDKGSHTTGISRMVDIVAKETVKKSDYIGKVNESDLSKETLVKDFRKRIKTIK